MQDFQVALLLLIFRLVNSLLEEALSEAPIAFQQIKTKDELVLKIIQPEDHPEYPGHNIEHLKIINDDWNKYYDCLNKKLQHEKEGKPILVQIMEGQYTSMKCPHCARPFEANKNLEWKYKPLSLDIDDPDELQLLDLAPQMRLTRKMTLKIYNAIKGYSGLYVCYHGNHPVSVYILEVVKDQRIITLNEEPPVNDTVKLPDGTNLQVYYLWSKWTQCSACNSIGKKYKYGTCMATLDQSSYSPEERVPTGYSFRRRELGKLRKNRQKSKERKKSDPTPELDVEETKRMKLLINKFQTGIPCTSYLMPNLYTTLIKNLNKTPSAAIVEYCKVDCTESTIFELMDHDGNVLEIANNSAGIYSSLQTIPQTLPEVERQTIEAEFGKSIVLQCPGNMNRNTPVSWMIDYQMLIPEIISNQSKGRIFIDLLNRIHINRLRLKDSHVYSCWQRDLLAGAVTLTVDKKIKLSYNHHIVLLSMLSIALTFLYVGIKILIRELKMRKTKLTG